MRFLVIIRRPRSVTVPNRVENLVILSSILRDYWLWIPYTFSRSFVSVLFFFLNQQEFHLFPLFLKANCTARADNQVLFLLPPSFAVELKKNVPFSRAKEKASRYSSSSSKEIRQVHKRREKALASDDEPKKKRSLKKWPLRRSFPPSNNVFFFFRCRRNRKEPDKQ